MNFRAAHQGTCALLSVSMMTFMSSPSKYFLMSVPMIVNSTLLGTIADFMYVHMAAITAKGPVVDRPPVHALVQPCSPQLVPAPLFAWFLIMPRLSATLSKFTHSFGSRLRASITRTYPGVFGAFFFRRQISVPTSRSNLVSPPPWCQHSVLVYSLENLSHSISGAYSNSIVKLIPWPSVRCLSFIRSAVSFTSNAFGSATI